MITEVRKEANSGGSCGLFIPGYVRDCPGLNHSDWVLLALVIQLSKNPRGCFATNQVLAQMLGFSPRTFARTMDRLRGRGLLVRANGRLRTPPEKHPNWRVREAGKAAPEWHSESAKVASESVPDWHSQGANMALPSKRVVSIENRKELETPQPPAGSARKVRGEDASFSKTNAASAGEVSAEPAGFTEFYELYPRRMNPRDALRAYLSEVSTPELHRQLMKGTRKAMAGVFRDRAMDKIPYPASWIRSHSWKDTRSQLERIEPKRRPAHPDELTWDDYPDLTMQRRNRELDPPVLPGLAITRGAEGT